MQNGCVCGLATPSWRQTILAQGPTPPHLSIHLLTAHRNRPCSLSRNGSAGHRFWQVGQKNVDRWACTIRRTAVPQRAHGNPARP